MVTDDVAAAVWSTWSLLVYVSACAFVYVVLFLRGIYVCTWFALDDFVTGTLAQNPCIF